MEENNINNQTKPGSKEKLFRKEMTEEQRERLKKMIIYPSMFILFLGAMWLIFAPSDKDIEKLQQGFNLEMPNPDDAILIGDKQKAYEQEEIEIRQKQRTSQMLDLADMFKASEKDENTVLDLKHSEPKTSPVNYKKANNPDKNIRSSANAYKDINKTLGNFYTKPNEDPEKEELRKQIEELREMVLNSKPSIDNEDQLALLEKSYELAAKYMPGNKTENKTDENIPETKNGKAIIQPITNVNENVVSALYQPMSNEDLIKHYSTERNYEFNTAIGNNDQSEVNTIKAVINENKTITNGQSIKLRLIEPMKAGAHLLPVNTVITGFAYIQGERLNITIKNIEHHGLIIPVSLKILDINGQEGIHIPGSLEMNAVKEVAANMGQNLGTSINISTDAKAQLVSDVSKSALQGASQYISKKVRIVKVHLKAGYQLMLYQEI